MRNDDNLCMGVIRGFFLASLLPSARCCRPCTSLARSTPMRVCLSWSVVMTARLTAFCRRPPGRQDNRQTAEGLDTLLVDTLLRVGPAQMVTPRPRTRHGVLPATFDRSLLLPEYHMVAALGLCTRGLSRMLCLGAGGGAFACTPLVRSWAWSETSAP